MKSRPLYPMAVQIAATFPRLNKNPKPPKMKISEINLGDLLRDTVTGFKGTAVAKTEWLNGCNRVAIQPLKLKDGVPAELVHMDVEQLELVKRSKLPAPTPGGGPMPNPTRAQAAVR